MADKTTVVGPPGTGKTTYLAREIARAVERYGPDGVLVASLTKTAAAEIAGRQLNVDPEHVGTLHALCYRSMQRPSLVDKTVAEFNKQYSRAISSLDLDVDDLAWDGPTEETGDDRLRRRMDLLRARMISRDLWPSDVRNFATDWEAWKMFTGTIDFTDMIERTLRAGGPAPGDPDVIFYDEAQDGSSLELALLSQWAEFAEHTVLAGDDRQALYVWRGAGVESFLNWSERKIHLSKTYRYGRAIHAYAQRWASQLSLSSQQSYLPKDEDGEVRCRDYVTRFPEDWISEVIERVDSGESVMLLTTCGYMLKPIAAVLKARGVPFHNPYRLTRGDWNPLAVKKGGKGPAARLLAFAQLSGKKFRPWSWSDLHRWVEQIKADVLPRGAKTRIAEHKESLEVVPFGVTDALIGRLALDAATKCDLDWYENSIADAKKERNAFAIHVAKSRGVDALRSHVEDVQGRPGKGLMLGTVHSVKGGESDAVYLWPDLSLSGMREYVKPQERDNVLRTIYVGITRARRSLTLCSPTSDFCVDWLPLEER